MTPEGKARSSLWLVEQQVLDLLREIYESGCTPKRLERLEERKGKLRELRATVAGAEREE